MKNYWLIVSDLKIDREWLGVSIATIGDTQSLVRRVGSFRYVGLIRNNIARPIRDNIPQSDTYYSQHQKYGRQPADILRCLKIGDIKVFSILGTY